MVKKNIKNTIEKHNLINAGEHIVIGLSGGPDSVCLFSVLNELKEELQITLHAVHVNHGFRAGAADEDQQYVEQLCEKCGIECTSFIYDCNAIAKENGLSSEEAGRKVRYEAFLKIADHLTSQGILAEKIKIAVAHNADDQAETVLFRLLRGTGTDGLAGMAYSRMEKNICVIRPLLDTWRKDIEAYCGSQGLEPRTDHTNLQPIYTRNKIRLDLIPYLQERFNPNVMEGLARLSAIAGEDKEYLWQCAEEAYAALEVDPGVQRQNLTEKNLSVTLDQQGLAELPPAIRHRVVMKALQELGLTQDVTAAHLDAVDSILTAAGESKTVEFPDGYRTSVRYGKVVFYNVNWLSSGILTADDSLQLTACGKNAHFSFSVCQMDEFSAKIHTPALQTSETGTKSHTPAPQTGETGTKSHTPAPHVAQSATFDTIRQAPALQTHQSATFDIIRQAPAPVPDNQTATFDAGKVAGFHGDEQPVLRTRRPGDYITIKGGRKKLQDLFVDMKVPKEHRDSVIVAAVGSEILWLPEQSEKGVKKARYSNRCKLDIDTKKVLILEIICET